MSTIGLVDLLAVSAAGAENLSPSDGSQPLWGLNESGFSSAEAPLYATDPWDTFWISGFQLPGQCELQGQGACRDYDSKKSKGGAGSRITFNGYRPMPFEVDCEIVTVAQWSKLQELTELLWTKVTSRVPPYQLAVTVAHPDLARLQIDRAVLVGLPVSRKGSIEGSRIFTFKFHEYYPTQPKNQTKTVSGAVREDPRKPSAASLANGAVSAPSSEAANLSTSGPKPQFQTPAGAE